MIGLFCPPLVVLRKQIPWYGADVAIAAAVARLLFSNSVDVAASAWAVILLHQHHRRLVQQLVLPYR